MKNKLTREMPLSLLPCPPPPLLSPCSFLNFPRLLPLPSLFFPSPWLELSSLLYLFSSLVFSTLSHARLSPPPPLPSLLTAQIPCVSLSLALALALALPPLPREERLEPGASASKSCSHVCLPACHTQKRTQAHTPQVLTHSLHLAWLPPPSP